MSFLTVLPLAFVRIAGPQIISATPQWMGKLQTADAGFSFRAGPAALPGHADHIITMFTVGASLTRHGQPWWHSLPLVLVTLLLVGLPLIDLLLLGKRGKDLLPQGAGLDDEQLVGDQRDRHRVLPRPHHPQPLQREVTVGRGATSP